MKNLSILMVMLMLVTISCSNENSNEEGVNLEDSIKKSTVELTKANGWVKIGKLDNDQIVLTANKQKLINSLNQNLLIGQEDYVNDLHIDRIKDSYYLFFTGEKIRVAFYVQLDKDNVSLMAAAKTSCSTSDPGCIEEQLGCIPEYPDNPPGQAGIGTCTKCSNGATCTKTVSGDPQIDP